MSIYYDDQFDILKDTRILSIEQTDEELKFNTENGLVSFSAEGDCCSSSFIESLDNPEIFNDSVFISVESVQGEAKDVDDYSVHKWTFYKFKTTKGMCTLSFRNESNGYYDGHLELVKD